jgi:hypothetical protein
VIINIQNQYYNLWSEDERNAIGIYEVIGGFTPTKKMKHIILIRILAYSYATAVYVIASYGTATPKPLDDILFVEGDEIPSDKAVGDVKQYGLKGICKTKVNEQANGLLSKYDWYVIRNTEDNTKTIPSDVSTYRTNVRTKANEMCTQIDGASTVDALKTLYTYTEDSEGNVTRPLAEFPEEL